MTQVVVEQEISEPERPDSMIQSASVEAMTRIVMGKETQVLVVDDEALNIAVVEAMLTSQNVQCDSALGGAEALEAIDKRIKLCLN